MPVAPADRVRVLVDPERGPAPAVPQVVAASAAVPAAAPGATAGVRAVDPGAVPEAVAAPGWAVAGPISGGRDVGVAISKSSSPPN
jgi:hypothetical protein